MTQVPPTRNSLILRLRNRRNVDAWQEFAAIYEPVVYRMARRRGLQHADALDFKPSNVTFSSPPIPPPSNGSPQTTPPPNAGHAYGGSASPVPTPFGPGPNPRTQRADPFE